jgi:hypothetical protein
MKYLKSMICWNVGGEIVAGSWPDRTGWSRGYRYSVGACFADRHKMTKAQCFIELVREFHLAVVTCKVDPHAADREFAKIDEYREAFGEHEP